MLVGFTTCGVMAATGTFDCWLLLLICVVVDVITEVVFVCMTVVLSTGLFSDSSGSAFTAGLGSGVTASDLISPLQLSPLFLRFILLFSTGDGTDSGFSVSDRLSEMCDAVSW